MQWLQGVTVIIVVYILKLYKLQIPPFLLHFSTKKRGGVQFKDFLQLVTEKDVQYYGFNTDS